MVNISLTLYPNGCIIVYIVKSYTFLGTLFYCVLWIFINMEKDRKILHMQENLFTTIAKILAYTALKRNLGSSKELRKGDQELQGSIASLKMHSQKLDKILTAICTRDPLNWRCKEYAKQQKQQSPNFK